MLKLEDLAALLEKHHEAASARVGEFALDGKIFPFNTHPAIMGVINLSADSWYRESVCLSVESAVQRGQVLQAQGADIVDIGAESTLAHAVRVDARTQKQKLFPIVSALRTLKILISIETYQPEVARSCLEAGANVLNLTGHEGSEEIFGLVAE